MTGEPKPILQILTSHGSASGSERSSTSPTIFPASLSPRRRLTNIPNSPSSPDLTAIPSPSEKEHEPSSPHRARSKTLPRRTVSGTADIPSLDGVRMDTCKLESLRRWILGIAIVTFDLEFGPVLACIFPPLRFYPFEAENIAFSALPDSAQFREGTSTHSFRIRERPISVSKSTSIFTGRPDLEDGFIYGYSYFNQKKDVKSKRGYAQWSIVILSQHPFVALFSSIIASLGPLYQTHGEAMLEVAAYSIANWPAPVPGQTAELGFVGSVTHAELPHSVDDQQLSSVAPYPGTERNWHVLACAPPAQPPSLHLFEASFTHLWSIWECLVLCEPILIFGSSPAMTSQAVWWLRDLFRPIPWAGDFRPYFTIHDGELNALVNDKVPRPGLLLGVTNPFFSKSCNHWPHVLSLGKEMPRNNSTTPTAHGAGPPPGWTTKQHKRYISKDPEILQQMRNALGKHPEMLEEASAAVRRHLSSRTAAMLVPLHRYVNSLIPSPTDSATRLRPFNNADFFASLKAHGSPLPFKSSGKKRLFYERWLRTPAFGLWLARQEEIVRSVLAPRTNPKANPIGHD